MLEQTEPTCFAFLNKNPDDCFLFIAGYTMTQSREYHFPFVTVYRGRGDKKPKYEFLLSRILKTNTCKTPRKVEIMPKTSEGWVFISILFWTGIVVMRLKDDVLQVIHKQEQLNFSKNPLKQAR